MVFGIDFDGTFNADPQLFALLVKTMRARGHSAVIVTGRSDEGRYGTEVRETLEHACATVGEEPPPVVFAGAKWKVDAAKEAGYAVDVWMDDHPQFVGRQDGLLMAGKLCLVAGKDWKGAGQPADLIPDPAVVVAEQGPRYGYTYKGFRICCRLFGVHRPDAAWGAFYDNDELRHYGSTSSSHFESAEDARAEAQRQIDRFLEDAGVA